MKQFTGYRFLQGPEQLPLSLGRRVQSPEEYRAWHTDIVTMRGGQPWDSPEAAKASINHGRWIADCRWCETAMLTRPDWQIACCAECGARYAREMILFPHEAEKITRLLCSRIRRDQQNWDDRQSMDELEKENKSPEVLTP